MLRHKSESIWQKGFTLIELLVVIGILGILIAVVLVAVNPSRQFASARDTQRRADLYAITNAMYQYATEHNGNFPNGTTPSTVAVSTTPRDIGTTGLNLGADLMPTYIPAIPMDPNFNPPATAATTHYTISLDANGRLVATAASELHQNVVISVTR